MSIDAFGLTHAGCVRANNEDAFSIDPTLCVAIVADGMGGHNSGEVASAITVDTVLSYLRHPDEEGLCPIEWMKEAVRAANRSVWETAQARDECKGMGSTIVAAHWCDRYVRIVNVGDSRAYLWRDGVLRQLSYDQNIGNDLRTALGLSDEQVRKYPHHNVLTMAVGVSPDVLIREHQEEWKGGDLVLLCSDGLYGPAGEEVIAATLSTSSPLDAMASELIDAANRAGGPDNITVAILRNCEA